MRIKFPLFTTNFFLTYHYDNVKIILTINERMIIIKSKFKYLLIITIISAVTSLGVSAEGQGVFEKLTSPSDFHLNYENQITFDEILNAMRDIYGERLKISDSGGWSNSPRSITLVTRPDPGSRNTPVIRFDLDNEGQCFNRACNQSFLRRIHFHLFDDNKSSINIYGQTVRSSDSHIFLNGEYEISEIIRTIRTVFKTTSSS